MDRFAVSGRSLYWSKTSSIEGGDRFRARVEMRGRGGVEDMVLVIWWEKNEERRGGREEVKNESRE